MRQAFRFLFAATVLSVGLAVACETFAQDAQPGPNPTPPVVTPDRAPATGVNRETRDDGFDYGLLGLLGLMPKDRMGVTVTHPTGTTATPRR